MKKLIVVLLLLSLSGCMKSCTPTQPHFKVAPELMQKPTPLQKL